MKLFTKDEANTRFGSMSVWNRSNMLANKMGYLAGVKVFDELDLLRNPKTGATLNLKVREKGIVFSVLKGFSFRFAGIPLGATRYVVIEPQAQIIEKKEKSVVGRAVVGGLLLGPLGAIVGGISGVGAKDVL